MNEYIYEVTLRAVVRVRAADEQVARKAVPTVLGSPGSVDIVLANENNAAIGRTATLTDVDFIQENEAKLLKNDPALPKARPSAA